MRVYQQPATSNQQLDEVNTEEIRTSVTWDTGGVDKGLQRVEKAIDRMEQAEKRSAKQAEAIKAQEAQRERRNKERVLRELEADEKASLDRRVKMTQDAYKRIAAEEKNRLAQFKQQAQVNNIRGGIGGSASVRAGGGGGAGGHGGGGLLGGGQNVRFIGDLLDQITGERGWVMRTGMLSHYGGALGRMLAPAGGAAAVAYGTYRGLQSTSELTDSTVALRKATGESQNSPWMSNPFTAPFLERMPAWARPQTIIGTRYSQSKEGMRTQSENIREEVEKAQDRRGGMGGYMRAFAKVSLATSAIGAVGAGLIQDREAQSLKAETRAQDKLLELDGKIAEKIKEQTAAKRLGVDVSEFAQRKAEAELQLNEKLEDLKAVKVESQEYTAARKAAEAEFGIETRRIEAEEKAANNENEHQRTLNEARKRGLGEVATAEANLNAARAAAETAIGQQAKDAAQNRIAAAETELEITKANVALRRSAIAGEITLAKSRGNTEERAMEAATEAVTRAEEKVSSLNERPSATKDEKDAAKLDLERAKQSKDLLERQQKVSKLNASGENQVGDIQVRSAGERLGLGNEPSARVQLQAGVDAAKVQLSIAEQIERVEKGSLASKQAVISAQRQLNLALLDQKSHELETARIRRNELEGLKVDTAAMRLANSGRSDKAELLQTRHQSEMAQYEALREGNPEKAEEIARQQQTRETGMYLQKYYAPDGRRRRAADIHREERFKRNAERRLNKAASRLEKNEGLTNVQRDMNGNIIGGTDPITGQKVTREQLYARRNAPKERADRDKDDSQKGLADIYKILSQRLPEAASK